MDIYIDECTLSRRAITQLIDEEGMTFDKFADEMYNAYWNNHNNIIEQLWSDNYTRRVDTILAYESYKQLFIAYFDKNVKNIFIIYKNGTDNLNQNFINEYIKSFSWIKGIKTNNTTISTGEYKFLQMVLSHYMESMVRVTLDILVSKIVYKYNLLTYIITLNNKMYSNKGDLNALMRDYEDDISSILFIMYNKLKNFFTLERVKHNLHNIDYDISNKFDSVINDIIPCITILFDIKFPLQGNNVTKDPHLSNKRKEILANHMINSEIGTAIDYMCANKKIETFNKVVESLQDIIDSAVEDIDESSSINELVAAIIRALYNLLARVQADIY